MCRHVHPRAQELQATRETTRGSVKKESTWATKKREENTYPVGGSGAPRYAEVRRATASGDQLPNSPFLALARPRR